MAQFKQSMVFHEPQVREIERIIAESTNLPVWNGIPFDGGRDGSDVTNSFLPVAVLSNTLNIPVLLPPWPILISATVVANRMIGVPGKSKIILAPDFTKTGYNNQFCFLNANFSRGYNPNTANYIWYEGFDVETTPNSSRSLFGQANVRAGMFKDMTLRVNQVINPGNGKPYVSDALIDLYACVKNVVTDNVRFENLTGGWGTTKISEGGGGCMWIRNLRSDSGAESITENNIVKNCTFVHQTSDEAIAIFGVLGVSRGNKIINNKIYGLDTLLGAYQPTLVSVFPLAGTSIDPVLGLTAATYDNVIADNQIESRSHLYNVLRIGNTPDASYKCYNNKLRNNIVTSYRSADPTNGPTAIWTAAGAVGVSPDQGSKAIRCIEGTQGLAYSGTFSGNESVNDTVDCTGAAQTNAAFSGIQKVTNPTSKNNCFSGVESCHSVFGGNVEAFGRSYFNCTNINGGQYRVTGTGGAYYAVEIDAAIPGQKYTINGLAGDSSARWVGITASVPSTASIIISGCTGSMNAGTVGAIVNNANASAVVVARNNIVTGTMSAPVSGTGTTVRTGNFWAGAPD